MKSNWETESTWDTEEVPPRNKLLHFIVQRVKQQTDKEHLLEVEVPEYTKKNNLPDFSQEDIEGMIGWAQRKFSPVSKDQLAEVLNKRDEEDAHP